MVLCTKRSEGMKGEEKERGRGFVRVVWISRWSVWLEPSVLLYSILVTPQFINCVSTLYSTILNSHTTSYGLQHYDLV